MNINISIRNKLFAALLLATLLVVLFMTFVIQWGFDRGFLEYVNIEEQAEIQRLAVKLEEYYAEYQSWDKLADNPVLVLKMHAEVLPPEKARHRLDILLEKERRSREKDDVSRDKKETFRRRLIQRTVILDAAGNIFFGEKLQLKLPHMNPLMYNGNRVGSIGMYLPKKLTESHQVTFIEKQTTFILMAFLVSMIIAIGISVYLAFSLARPIRQLSFAAKRLTEGDYSVRVKAGYRDELSNLSQDFNTLASTLKENELQRERWVSDIAHELRTPLTSLKGQIEALQDGIREPDQKTYALLQRSVVRLERLVNDLYDLNLSDLRTFALAKEKVALDGLVEAAAEARLGEAKNAGLKLATACSPMLLFVHGDSQRLLQMIDNLLTNSLRYTDHGGEVNLLLKEEGSNAILEIIDSAPGVPDEALPRLFDRLYRVEESRNRALGGAGLGLAICREIVLAHGGSISAHPSVSGGLRVIVSLPLFTDKES